MGYPMASVTFLLCCGLFHGATTETPLRKRVIESFIGELAEKPLDDPRFIQILEVILDKVEETEEPCLVMGETGCSLYVSTDNWREKRDMRVLKPYLSQLVGNITRKTFPALSNLLTDIFANNTKIGGDIHDQFDTSAQILLIKTIERLSDFTHKLGYYKAPILTLLTLILTFATVFLIAGIIRGCERCREIRRERKARKYDEYFRRRNLALEA